MPLTHDDRQRALASLGRFCREELAVEFGNVELGQLLDFVLTELGPSVYNAALADAKGRIEERLSELDSELYRTEFPYWPRAVRRKAE